MDIKDLYDLASEVDGHLSCLEDTMDALHLLYDQMESSGYQRNDERFDPLKAELFIRNEFPGFHSYLRLIINELDYRLEQIRKASDTGYEIYFAEKKKREGKTNAD